MSEMFDDMCTESASSQSVKIGFNNNALNRYYVCTIKVLNNILEHTLQQFQVGEYYFEVVVASVFD